METAFLDHRRLDLAAARRITYRIEQTLRHDYPAPVTDLTQRLVIVPRRRHGDLRRHGHVLEVRGAEHVRRTRSDAIGNTVVRVRAPRVEQAVEVRLIAELERVVADGPPVLPAGALRDPRLLRHTRLTTPDEALRDLAAGFAPGDDLADRISAAVHGAVTYTEGVTGVRTTAAEALRGGHGTSQDHAHVMLVLCRLHGLPARYVSGHLLGQDGTHAWVEVLQPRGDHAVAVAHDPCHGRRAGAGHLTVAVGRDAADVRPASATFRGPPGGRLSGSRRVGVLTID
jgi:transglutaminase-like putative cysteine protease